MPQLDVTELLLDPDFAERISVTRQTQTVNSNGVNVVTPTVYSNLVAIVEAAQGTENQFLEDLARVKGVIQVHTTTFLLTDGTGTFAPDIVTWNSREYLVLVVNDWSKFGAGYTCATCQLKSLTQGTS